MKIKQWEREYNKILNTAKLTAGSIALLYGFDVDTAVGSAGVAVENNSLKKQTLFAAKNPIIAAEIGSVAYGDTLHKTQNPNISTVASTFQINLINNSNKTISEVEITREGGVANAFRHTLWQALIANRFGVQVAIEAGDAHETTYTYKNTHTHTHSNASLILGQYAKIETTDEIADQLNNAIGRSIYQNNPNKTNKEYAHLVLNHYHYKGLYQVEQRSNGQYGLVIKELPSSIYKRAIITLETLDETGAGSVIQQKRIDYQKK
ncbi:DUF6973 domain-containing protein [Moraxella marmotae]|uniref:DUF6973 domain-containing protein n=1 Tax=Moraxella marmotae TaxID=3344520 RepID=UPI0035F39C99